MPEQILAHVKWFTTLSPGRPAPLADVLQPAFLGGLALTLVVALALTWLNVPLQELGWVRRIHAALERLKPYSGWIIRIGLAVPLLGGGVLGHLYHYELAPVGGWVRWAQLVLGVLILIPGQIAPKVGAAGVALLGFWGVAVFGLHHMLDYVAWLGACYFLLVQGTPWEGTGIAPLYIATGISLTWGAIEKWVYPAMSLDILQHHPIPTFGFPPGPFLVLSGWVEFGVAYLLITGVLNRLLSLVVTLLFVLTSSVFGWREVLGHWQLHATLILFLVEGTGAYVTPVLWHRGKGMQLLFVGVTLFLYLAVTMSLYYALAAPG